MTEIQKLVPSTYKILKEKTINADIDKLIQERFERLVKGRRVRNE